MWSLKYSMSKTPMTDCVAMNVTMSPARKDTVRFADQLPTRCAPIMYSINAANISSNGSTPKCH